ncbi:low affinity immunoglobulin gamma Fc region receptor II-a-like [Morone saxatilis]|uniref:low affinity immunoglobulin gamma Fc region receptor II-a-like n=1 Tax=Morone saxatilis TaxID=34816 RepID=UPI0015E239C9|nr:low affinity immunoglobulin gamma Fc region receptor II-a-like [Morone saxatilis]
MEVTALCIRLVIHVLMLLVAEDQHCYCAEKADAAFLRVAPNKLQFFEYDSISFDCEGFDDFTEWRLMRRIMGVETICSSKWETSWGRCFIKNAFELDSGEYWCEANGTMTNNFVTISVTAGSVIMESPALPVTEGDNVTLSCRNKTTSSVPIADFYKDGNWLKTGYEGHITIYNVSKSDEGHYKCIIGVEESAQSWLTVRAPPSLHEDHSSHLFILCITVALCLVALPLLFMGLCLCGRYRDVS